MAIVLEEKQKFNWKALIIFIAVVMFLFAAAYFLFFSPVPAIEVIIPLNIKSTTEISTVEFKPGDLTGDKIYQSLRPAVGPAVITQVGRANPFIKY